MSGDRSADERPRLGVDIGGTSVKLGIVVDGRVVQRTSLATTMTSAATLVATIAAAAQRLQRDAGLRPCAAGVGVPGVLAAGGARVLQSPNLPWLDGVDLSQVLGVALGLPVRCDNDANCLGWGEAVAGAGRGLGDQFCLTLGTGVGGSLMIADRIEHGGRGRGMELGHICVEPNGPACGCGGRGCLEQFASQTGLLRMMTELGLPTEDTGAGDGAIPGLFALAANGDPLAGDVVNRAGAALGRAIASLYQMTGVGTFIIAGGISAALSQLRPAMAHALVRFGAAGATVHVGSLGAEAAIIGAALLETP